MPDCVNCPNKETLEILNIQKPLLDEFKQNKIDPLVETGVFYYQDVNYGDKNAYSMIKNEIIDDGETVLSDLIVQCYDKSFYLVNGETEIGDLYLEIATPTVYDDISNELTISHYKVNVLDILDNVTDTINCSMMTWYIQFENNIDIDVYSENTTMNRNLFKIYTKHTMIKDIPK